MSKLSKDYVSDSDSEDEVISNEFSIPDGFKKCKHLKSFPLDSDNTKKFKQQQVWLLKFPSKVDISKLKSLPIDFESSAAMSIDNHDYTVVEDTDIETLSTQDNQSNMCLLAPSKNKENLQIATTGKDSAPLRFDKIISISEAAKVPAIDFDKVRVPRKDVPKVEGLKLEHFATGYGAKDFGVTENTVTKEHKKTSKKRSHQDDEEEGSKDKKKKKKKEKKDKKKKQRD
ncbi:DNA-directed RNA polymerase I subunit RPA34 SKDI_10G0690 [Saccharomyces kudriavzevii IFO 1802]|uniref:RPA34-like protein n=2 Tax=Saccharomyces kudriavzevii (strain ATCC MYA-4449 / AS 2.2408 / CBS 8840 / NBRC 1802 / NCYC 2889) TaxID=226230 RepID=J6EJ34_SACK1|nr:uncharacterized protein SKDI_10G0690 [Saccharomyces kudriavzevii IFO 1802]EJT43889.1 RPA34-like protein [Saccharomyces kudriavzevii IFO 1802]CAI4043542.1 hypothetical protein SKDI_10G0690 [Saccharomyces kudriavzevii IFO 1802]